MVRSFMDDTYVVDRFGPIIESAPNAVLLIDQNGTIRMVNAETEKLFGYVQDALVGESVNIFVPEPFRHQHDQHVSSFFARPTARALGEGRDFHAVRKDGTEFPVEIGLHPITTEDATFVLGTVIDITERKRSEDRIRLVVEAAPSAMIMADREGKIVLVNSQVETTFGYDREELIGRPVEILVPQQFRSGHPRHRASFYDQPSTRVMGAGRDLFAVRKDGTEFPVEIGLSPVEMDDELLVLSTIVDISERKRAENALRKSEANLRDALEQLERQTVELQCANESLAQYAYVVSHDVRAPLRAIHNYTDFLKEDLEGMLAEEQQEYLGGLEEAVAQAEQLVEDLLLLSRVERRENATEVIDVGVFLQDLVRTLPLPPDAEIDLASGWPTLAADTTLIRQIFQNLILNGVKFNDSSPKRVELGCSYHNDAECEFYVRDNGIGIEPRHQEQIFRVFQRLHDSEEYEGTGIGLAIVKKAVSKPGGSIRLESEAGKGSTFFVKLPVAPVGSKP